MHIVRCLNLASFLGQYNEVKILRVLAYLEKRELDKLKQLSKDFWDINDIARR